jgi:hypothetical protein
MIIEKGFCLFDCLDTSVESKINMRKLLLQLIDILIFQRRNYPVFRWAQPFQNSISCMHNKVPYTAVFTNLFHKISGEFVIFNFINTQPAFDRTRNLYSLRHCCQTSRNKARLLHQTRPKAAALDSRTWAPNIQVNFIIAEFLGNFTRFRKLLGVTTTQLQHNWVFNWAELKGIEHFLMISLINSIVVDHLGVECGLRSQ